MSNHWMGLPYLDALRPAPGWITERAILTTYSADLVAVIAALLALAGLDDDRGSGSKVDFANAYEQLHGKVHILVQTGQIGWPAKKISILAILDRFLKEVNQDQGIWHPKLALVKFASDAQHENDGHERQALWRLWIGSRNLTRSLDWDAGMVLVSHPNGAAIPGIADLGADLGSLAGLEALDLEQIRHELAQVHWRSPKGVEVGELRLMTTNSQRGLPEPAEGIKKLVVISPFLDGGTVKRLGTWGDARTERVLLSIRSELARLHSQASRPLSKFAQLLALDAPEPEDAGLWLEDDQDERSNPSGDEEIEARGLHAKLIYVEHSAGRILWVGSANATSAAWDGPNSEAVAQLEVHHDDVADGLFEFVGMAQPVDPLSLSTMEISVLDEPLDQAHREVVARWTVSQERHPDGPRLVCDHPPHPDHTGIEMEVGLLACDAVPWPRDQTEVQLPSVSSAQETELVQVRLRMGQQRRAWLQFAPLQPPPGEERDHRALSRYLDPRTFLLWIRSLLHAEDTGDGGGDWDTAPLGAEQQASLTDLSWWAPTLEQMLKAWSRNAANLRAVDQKIERYLEFVQDRADDTLTSHEQELLEEFRQTWLILRNTLMVENG